MFESLLGVFVVCHGISWGYRMYTYFVFQSLSGVLDVCNNQIAFFIVAETYRFQSLSGVLDVCNISSPEAVTEGFKRLQREDSC
jgi:hypothetical protein